jgi:hypothetical protein
MQRFRFTLMAVCLLLLFLGGSDLKILFENPHPHQVALAALVRGEVPGAPRTRPSAVIARVKRRP